MSSDLDGRSFSLIGQEADLISHVEQLGAGTRGIVFGNQGLESVGHVFNAVNQGGNVRMLDGQAGATATLTGQGYIDFHFMRTDG